MASIWAAIGGAADTYQGLWMQEYEQKLKQQEEAAKEAREERIYQRRRADTKADEIGRPLATPQRAPGDTDYRAPTRLADGSFGVASFGQADKGILAREKAEEAQAAADYARDVRKDDAQIANWERRARGGGGSGGPRGMTAGQTATEVNRIVEEGLENNGWFKRNGQWMMQDPASPTKPDKIVPVPANTLRATRSQLREQAKAGGGSPQEPEQRGILASLASLAGGVMSGGQAPEAAPPQSKEEIIAEAIADNPGRSRDEVIARLRELKVID
jgi:hypothetical protein